MENGYHLFDFKGAPLRDEHIERFKQFLWRPRPPTLLPKEDIKEVRKNLREYSRQFDEEDAFESESANKEIIEARKRLLDEWFAWREKVEKNLRAERRSLGLVEDIKKAYETEGDTVIEEIVEEVLHESEEIIS